MNEMFVSCLSILKASNAWMNESFTVGKKLMERYKKQVLQQITVLRKHIFVKREQNKFYNNLKENLEENEAFIHVDSAKTIATKINKKSKVRTSGMTLFQYLRPAAIFVETTVK